MWITSSWWPPGATFRCGCGLTAGGAASAWNDVAICGALGDLLYATGQPQLDAQTGSYTFGFWEWPSFHPGWSDAAANVSADYCSFKGVHCDPAETGCVYPDATPGMVGVEWLGAVAGSAATATLPPSFSALAALPGLNTVNVGSFGQALFVDPEIFAPMTTLTSLKLLGMTLQGSLLSSWAALRSLKELDISWTNVSGTLPPEFGALTQLTAFWARNNALQGSVPDSWGSLTALETLSISQNSLSGTLPAETLCRMTSLTYLYLDFNEFTGGLSSLRCLSQKGALRALDLRGNQLSGTIPEDIASWFTCGSATASGFASWNVALGLAGNVLTGGVPLSLSKDLCFAYSAITLRSSATVCTPGSAATRLESDDNWQNASCALCPAGAFSSSLGAVACTRCAPFSVAPQPGAVACTACPANSRDSDDNTACACVDGYFDAALGGNSTAPTCVPCTDGGVCVGGQLLAQEGFWRESPTDAVFLKCREGYCLAEEAPPPSEATPLRRRLAQLNASAGHCADGHGGPLCAVCLEEYTMQGGFCQPCREQDAWRAWSRPAKGITIAFFVPAGALLLTLLLLLPLLPAWERALWHCTTALATAAEGVAGAVAGATSALRRRCTGAAEEEHASPLSSITPRLSTDSADPDDDDAVGSGGVDELIEAAMALLTMLAKPGKILIKCVRVFACTHGTQR